MKGRKAFRLLALGWGLALSAIWVSSAFPSASVVLVGGPPFQAPGQGLAAVTFDWQFHPCNPVTGQFNNQQVPFFRPVTVGTPLCFSRIVTPATQVPPCNQGNQNRYVCLTGCALVGALTAPAGSPCGGVGDVACGVDTTCARAYALISKGPGSALATSAAGDTGIAKTDIRVAVSRSSNSVTIRNFSGELRNDLGSVSTSDLAQSNFTLAVYADTNVYKRDLAQTGVGAIFVGRVFLTKSGTINTLDVKGGFVAGDFVLSSPNARSNVATPSATLSKVVAVPNGANAVVAVIADPHVGSESVPGAPPSAIAVMSLLLAGAGIWFLTARARPQAA